MNIPYLSQKGISLSPRIYFIDAMSYMALGLFSSLIIGLIIKTAGGQLHLDLLTELGSWAQKSEIVGAAMGVAIAYALKAPPLILFASVMVGAYANGIGGPAGCYITVLITCELAKLVYKTTRLDIIITPFCTLFLGFLLAKWFGVPLAYAMTRIGEAITWAMQQQPWLMSMLVAWLMGWALTAPISSVAIAFMLGLSGAAAGASVIGCAGQMVGFAVISYRDNGFGGALAQGIGTSMLQIGNILKNPWIILPPTLGGVLAAPPAIVMFDMVNNTAGAGMGTSGLVGQIMAFESQGYTLHTALLVLVFHILIPALVAYAVDRLLRRYGKIKDGDMLIRQE